MTIKRFSYIALFTLGSQFLSLFCGAYIPNYPCQIISKKKRNAKILLYNQQIIFYNVQNRPIEIYDLKTKELKHQVKIEGEICSAFAHQEKIYFINEKDQKKQIYQWSLKTGKTFQFPSLNEKIDQAHLPSNQILLCGKKNIYIYNVKRTLEKIIPLNLNSDRNHRPEEQDIAPEEICVIGAHQHQIYTYSINSKQLSRISINQNQWETLDLTAPAKGGLIALESLLLLCKNKILIFDLSQEKPLPEITPIEITLEKTPSDLMIAGEKIVAFHDSHSSPDHSNYDLTLIEPHTLAVQTLHYKTFGETEDAGPIRNLLILEGLFYISMNNKLLIYDPKTAQILARVDSLGAKCEIQEHNSLIFLTSDNFVPLVFPAYPSYESVFALLKSGKYGLYFKNVKLNEAEKKEVQQHLDHMQKQLHHEVAEQKNKPVYNLFLGGNAIPLELQLEILSYLNPKELANFGLTSKYFYTLSKKEQLKIIFHKYIKLALLAIHFMDSNDKEYQGKESRKPFLDYLAMLIDNHDPIGRQIAESLKEM